MLRCASSFVIAAYAKVRLIPQDSRALPAAFLRSRPIFTTFKTFYEVANLEEMEKNAGILYERNAVAACLRIFREKGYRLVIFKGYDTDFNVDLPR
jgi:hypothetical protein